MTDSKQDLIECVFILVSNTLPFNHIPFLE